MLIGYARVSKSDNSQVLDLQIDALVNAGVKEENIYSDKISGSKDENERPWLKRMKEDIKNGKIQAVVVYRLDRLARNTKVLLSLIEEFNKHGIIFMSVNERLLPRRF